MYFHSPEYYLCMYSGNFQDFGKNMKSLNYIALLAGQTHWRTNANFHKTYLNVTIQLVLYEC